MRHQRELCVCVCVAQIRNWCRLISGITISISFVATRKERVIRSSCYRYISIWRERKPSLCLPWWWWSVWFSHHFFLSGLCFISAQNSVYLLLTSVKYLDVLNKKTPHSQTTTATRFAEKLLSLFLDSKFLTRDTRIEKLNGEPKMVNCSRQTTTTIVLVLIST